MFLEATLIKAIVAHTHTKKGHGRRWGTTWGEEWRSLGMGGQRG